LLKAGDHTPAIPLVEAVGKGLKAAPLQTGLIALKVGVTGSPTVIVIVVELAHCPADGVNVYVVVVVLFKAGNQEPLILLLDVVGNGEIEEPVQTCPTGVNVGATCWLTAIVIEAVDAHCPAEGVNV
jgi:hypothetical protein